MSTPRTFRHALAAAILAAHLGLPAAGAAPEDAPEMKEVARHMQRAWYREHRDGVPLDEALRAPREADSFAPLDASYEAMTAERKLLAVFDRRIVRTAYPDGDYPSLLKGLLPVAKTLFPSKIRPALTRVADEFPRARLKFIHTFGTTAKMEFVPHPDSPFTGIFQGAAGVGRFSYAGPPIPFVGNVPGLGLKFFVDGKPSENLVVMHGLNSQGRRTSVFENTFSNILPRPRGPIMNAIRSAFERVVGKENGFIQPLDNLAGVDRHGDPVAEPKAPYRIFFEPVDSYPFPADSERDFRRDLETVPPGSTIYTVWGQETSVPHPRIEMGTLVTRSRFVASAYGDTKLFFKHNARFLLPSDS